ncbi:MAG: phosphopyruvate hydratase [Patescibacteria group bacterium]|nr:phosphopyruvate hydratase [Patescibacteria group bacterium]
MKIKSVSAIQIINSRGIPTLKAYVALDTGEIGWSMVPQGASTGKHEAAEIFDNNPQLFAGFSLQNNIQNINDIINNGLKGLEITDQSAIDKKLLELDGTTNKGKLGANTILAVSSACVRAGAMATKKELFQYISEISGNKKISLPTPMFNIINGGAHTNNNLEIQEFMVIPSANSFFESIKIGVEIYLKLKAALTAKGQSTGLGDEGGFSPLLNNNQEAMSLIKEAIEATNNQEKVFLGLDLAANGFYRPETKQYQIGGKLITSDQLINYYQSLNEILSIKSIEDPMSENDTVGWQKIIAAFPNLQIVGDDLFTTNPEIIREKNQLANAVIIKPNQIGTISETFSAISEAKNYNMKIIISHRSGETEDPFIADLAVGIGAEEIKSGSLARSERLAKYNRLLEIEALHNLPYTHGL